MHTHTLYVTVFIFHFLCLPKISLKILSTLFMSHTNGWLTVNYIGSHNILLLSYYCNVRLLYSISYDERYLLEFRTPEGLEV